MPRVVPVGSVTSLDDAAEPEEELVDAGRVSEEVVAMVTDGALEIKAVLDVTAFPTTGVARVVVLEEEALALQADLDGFVVFWNGAPELWIKVGTRPPEAEEVTTGQAAD